MAVIERTGEAVVSLALFGLGAAMAVQGAHMPIGTLSLPGPGFFPTALGALLAVCGLGCAARALLLGGSESVSLGGWRPWATLLVLAVSAFAFEPVGAPLTLAAMLVALFLILGRQPLLRSVAYGILASALSYFLFTRLLGVGLPEGLLAGFLPA